MSGPLSIAAGIPAGVDAFFKKALAAEPAARYATAAELAAAAEGIRA